MVASLPDQWARAADLEVEGPDLGATEVLVCGMGGSGIAGDVAAVTTGRRVDVHKGYGLPAWAADARPLVAVVTYSGSTEEAIDAFVTARRLGLDVVSVTASGPIDGEVAHVTVPAGLQPRAAFGHLVGGLLAVLHAVGATDDPRPALAEAADVVAASFGHDFDGPGAILADDLAEALADRFPIVHGSPGPAGVAAYRWKCQFNENAKTPAWASTIPELDHNELAGWRGIAAERRLAVIALRDSGEHPRVAARFELTRELGQVATIGEVRSTGETALARLASLAAVGDLVSLALAERHGVDPVEVDVLTTLKSRLGAVPA